jgi:hypothetical protein
MPSAPVQPRMALVAFRPRGVFLAHFAICMARVSHTDHHNCKPLFLLCPRLAAEPGFPSRQTRNAFARRSCSNKELERIAIQLDFIALYLPPVTDVCAAGPRSILRYKRCKSARIHPRRGQEKGLSRATDPDRVVSRSRRRSRCIGAVCWAALRWPRGSRSPTL